MVKKQLLLFAMHSRQSRLALQNPRTSPIKSAISRGYISISLSPDQNHVNASVMLVAGARRSCMENIPIFFLLMPPENFERQKAPVERVKMAPTFREVARNDLKRKSRLSNPNVSIRPSHRLSNLFSKLVIWRSIKCRWPCE
jgi:hypothetical protein